MNVVKKFKILTESNKLKYNKRILQCKLASDKARLNLLHWNPQQI